MSDDSIRLTRRRLLGGVAVTGAATAGLGAGSYALLSDTEQSTDNTIQAGTLDLEVGDDGFQRVTFGYSNGPSNLRPGDLVDFQIELRNVGTVEADYLALDFDYSVTESTNGDDAADTDPNTGTSDSKGDMGKLFEVFRLNYNADGTSRFIRKDSDEPNGPLDDIERVSTSGSEIAYENNNIVDLHDLKEHTGTSQNGEPIVADQLSPPPAANDTGNYLLEGSFVFVDTRQPPEDQKWPGYRTNYDPKYTGDQDNNWYQGDDLTLEVSAELVQDPS